MSGESIVVFGTTVNAVTSGASLATTVFSTTVSNSVTTSYALANLVFSGVFASAPAAGLIVNVYRRDKNIKGANHAPVPSANNKAVYVGSFLLSTDTTQYLQLSGVPLAPDCDFYIENQAGVTLNSAWTLDVKPFGYGIAP